MEIKVKNLEALKRNHERIYHELQKDSYESEMIISVESYPTINEEKMLVFTKEERMYRLNSMYNPMHEAQRFVKHINFKNEEAPIMLFGFGNGIIVRELLRNCNDSMHVIVYEPSIEIFSHVVEEYDIEDILRSPKCSLVIEGVNEQDLKRYMYERIGYLNLNVCINLIHPNYVPAFIDSYSQYEKDVKWFRVGVFCNRNTLELLGKECVINAIHNLSTLESSKTITQLRGKVPAEVPAIIVAAGPSLDKNIHQLKKAKGRSIIIAVDRAINALLEHGIIPDCSVTMDAKKPMYCYEREESKHIPLIYALCARKEIVMQHLGDKVVYNSEHQLVSLLNEILPNLGLTLVGGSVATAAFSIAVELGAKNIILVGQDLAFANGNTHASGAVSYKNEEEVMLVPGIMEPFVETIPNLYLYAQWFEKAAKSLPDGYTLIDATEGGMLKEGYINMSLEETIQRYCVKEFCFESILTDNEENSIGKSKKITSTMNQVEKEFYTIKKYVNQAKHVCLDSLAELKTKGTNKVYMQNKSKLDYYDDVIYNCLGFGLLDMYTAAYTLDEAKGLNIYEESEVAKHIKVLTKAYNVYGELGKGVKELIETLEESMKR